MSAGRAAQPFLDGMEAAAPGCDSDEAGSMARVTDVVCGMTIDSDSAGAHSNYQGREYYFCSEPCKREFESDPGRFAIRTKPLADAPESAEGVEPPFTKSNGVASPKFGSAGSGGAEYEGPHGRSSS